MLEAAGKSPIWGSRFAEGPHPLFFAYGRSVEWDRRLATEDIKGSVAHVHALLRAGVLTSEIAAQLESGLKELADDVRAGQGLAILPEDEDVHGAIERLLGPIGGYLHAGRSRNDQVALDFHLYCKAAAKELATAAQDLEEAILQICEAQGDKVWWGMTHLQPAQPVLVAHHFLAYFWMFERDRRRFLWAEGQADRSPLGAGALAGAGVPVDPASAAEELGFESVYENSMDAVSDRDFALDLGHAAATAALHLSRLGEEIVLFSAPAFGLVQLPDAFASGSSMMPQKKNPDGAELLRGRAGRVLGAHLGLMTTLKGLPLAYVRDLQEDKEATFSIVDATLAGLRLAAAMLPALELRGVEIPRGDLSLATDLADHLVRAGVPFRQAHHIVGQAVRAALEAGGDFTCLDAATWQALSPHFTPGALAQLLDPRLALERRSVPLGTAPGRVQDQLAHARALLDAAD